MNDITTIIGANIRSIRRDAGKNLKEVAGHLGISFQQVQKYERGLNRISADYVFLLAEYFGVEIAAFYYTPSQSEQKHYI